VCYNRDMCEQLKVILSSEVFGAEEFPRDTLDEAIETVRSLVKSSIECHQKDGIVRQVTVEVGTE
jgi:hypothetical protein